MVVHVVLTDNLSHISSVYKTNGIFQTTDDVNAYKNADGGLIQPKAMLPTHDVRFVDVNGDGQITP